VNEARGLLEEMLASRLPGPSAGWLVEASAEIARGVGDERFSALVSLASRHVPRGALVPDTAELADAAKVQVGWNPERWSRLDAVRCLLVLSRRDLEEPTLPSAIEEAFRFADVGEMGSLHRSLQLLPGPERFVWRAGEGCRSNMRSVFEAAACDTGYPAANFDDLAWRQLVIKALFVEAPLWRVYGLDGRLDAELARMALDLAEERRSAGRPVRHELWLCLGRHGGKRGLESMERELAGTNPSGRRAAVIGLARAGERKRLAEHAERERDDQVAAPMRDALEGKCGQHVLRDLDPARPANVS
jgi:hypothetical protein